jgi:hypothetical protein
MPDNNASATKLRAVRPAVTIAGKDRPELTQALLSLIIAENISGLYRCEAMFGNWGNINNRIDFLYFDRQLLDFGKALQIKLSQDIIFDGKIMALEAHFPEARPPEILVLAEDRFQDLRMTRRTRTFADLTDADVINQIATEHGLSPQIDLPGPQHKVLAQINQSDLAFIRERVRTIDGELWMSGNTLHAVARSKREGAQLQMAYNRQIRHFTVLADLAGQRTGVTVAGWDVAGKSRLNFEATDSVISGELNGDLGGASILASAFSERKESLVHTVPITSQITQAEAEAYFKMCARRFVVGRGVAEADARLRVGSSVDIQGLGPLFNGKYYLSEVRHVFDAEGLRTEFTAERPGIGRA